MQARAALLILRIGLGAYLLLWSLGYLAHPDAARTIAERLTHARMPHAAAYAVGGALVALSLAFLIGACKSFTYATATLVYAASAQSALRALLHPFDKPPQAFAALPVLAAFIALFLLRDKDSLGTL